MHWTRPSERWSFRCLPLLLSILWGFAAVVLAFYLVWFWYFETGLSLCTPGLPTSHYISPTLSDLMLDGHHAIMH